MIAPQLAESDVEPRGRRHPTEPTARRLSAPRTILASAGGGLLAVVALQFGQLASGRNPLVGLRTAYWHDQLGYLAIASNAAEGRLDNVEPVTSTGISHYPQLYYSLVGVFARMTGLPTVVSWNVMAISLQFLAAFALGLVVAGLSRRRWLGLAAPVPFLTGTFAYLQGDGVWFTPLESHAVLWGPVGALFSNNAESAGLCVGLMAACGLVWAWRPGAPPRRRVIATIAASAAIGTLSSFQTYSFLSLTYLFAFGAAASGIAAAPRRRALLLASTGALVAVVFVAGPPLSVAVGQLPTLLFGLLPAVPGLIAATVRSRGLVAIAGIAALLTAAPQILYTMSGVVEGDPFLAYRVASNHELGIVSWAALGGALVVLVALVSILIVGFVVRDTMSIVIASTLLVTLPILALNDVWGANAEPYRFWIDGLLLGGAGSLVALSRLIRVTSPRWDALRSGGRRATSVLVVVTAVIWAAALPDWFTASRDDEFQDSWNPYTSRERAITELARTASAEAPGTLLTTEGCIDNRTIKANSGSAVANYHLGMAWPADREAIDDVVRARERGVVDVTAMNTSHTRWFLTDSACDSDIAQSYDSVLREHRSVDYVASQNGDPATGEGTGGSITLWQLAGTTP